MISRVLTVRKRRKNHNIYFTININKIIAQMLMIPIVMLLHFISALINEFSQNPQFPWRCLNGNFTKFENPVWIIFCVPI